VSDQDGRSPPWSRDGEEIVSLEDSTFVAAVTAVARTAAGAGRLWRMNPPPIVSVIMGSRSDWETLSAATEVLDRLAVPHEVRVVSAHRTPDLLFEFAEGAEARGIEVIIAGAGGAAHLPGMVAAKTHLPVLGVPVQSKALNGLDSLLSIVQMPAGIPVGTLAIGRAGATNAGLLAASIVGRTRPAIRDALLAFRRAQTDDVLGRPDPRDDA